MRDVTQENNPKIVSTMEINDNDVIPQIGDKISETVKKKGFKNASMFCSRTYDVKQRSFYIKGGNDGKIISVSYELVNDGTEVDN